MSSLFSWNKKPGNQARATDQSGREGSLPSTDFAIRLLEKLNLGERNLIFSPYSVRLILALLWAGSEGETRLEMTRALGLDESLDNPSNHYERLGQPLGFQRQTNGRMLHLSVANALWCDEGIVIRNEYAKSAKEDYWAEIQTLCFTAESSADKINSWAKANTQGLIPIIIGSESLRRSSPLVATNAVYFKGAWKDPFEEELTKKEDFTLLDGTKKLVPLMRRSGEFGYTRRNGAQIVQLPYKESMSMFVILPPKQTSISEFCNAMRTNLGMSWSRGLRMREGHLRLPRFCIDMSVDLTKALQAIGIVHAFEPQNAAFGGLSDRTPLFLNGVLQSSYVDVNEEGTEAAAVTRVLCFFDLDPEPPPPPFEMIVDRPFVFAIRDDQTGTMVFLGIVVDPTC